MRKSSRGLVLSAGIVCVVVVAGCARGPTEPNGLSQQDLHPAPLAWPGPNFLDTRLAGCPTAAEIASVRQVNLRFEQTALTGPLVCRTSEGSADLTGFQKEAYFALILMRELRFERDLPWTRSSLYDWFLSTNIELNFIGASSNSFYSNGRIVIFLGSSPDPELQWPDMQRLIGTLAHENRHAEGVGHTCGTRDRSIADGGAWAYHNHFITWIGLYSDPLIIPAAYRPHALQSACTQQNSAFCLDPEKSCR